MKSGELPAVGIEMKPMPKFVTLGALSDRMPDHLYALTNGRRIYTSPWLQENLMRRCAASICLTTTGMPFKVITAQGIEWHSACAMKPMVQRALHANDVGLISFQFEPSHSLFPRFRRISTSGVLPLDRRVFAQLNEPLNLAYRGGITASQASELFEAITTIALRYLPRAKPIDSRVAKVVDMLWRKHDAPLGELAECVGLSYFRLSHLFADNMGVTLRHYQQWRKLRKAISLSKQNRTLAELATASGFADAAHFSRAFTQLYAAPPSYFFQSGNVRIVSPQS